MIELAGVTLQRGGRELFRDFSLTLPDPGLYTFLGGTGSGKTLLAKLLTGQLKPQRGTVNIDGSPLYGWLPLNRAPSWYCAACDDVRSAETLENYLQTTLYDAGGNLRDLRPVMPTLLGALDVPAEASLETLSQGQLALAQIALAGLLPVRIAVLDGQFGLLDEAMTEVAAHLLSEHHTQSESLVLLMSTRLNVELAAEQARYVLQGSLPVQLAEVAAEEQTPTEVTAGGSARRILRITLDGGRQAGVAYQSGTAYMVRGVLERGLRVELKGDLAHALAEMDASGLRVKAIEWE